MKKRILIILLAFLGITFSFLFVVKFSHKAGSSKNFFPNKGEIIKKNKNENFLKYQIIDGLRFEKIDCVYDGKISTVSYEIKNVNDHEITFDGYDLQFLDKNDVLISSVALRITRTLDPGEVTTVSNEVFEDVSNAYSMNFKIIYNEEESEETN